MERFGIYAALLTPFAENGEIDTDLLVRHTLSLLADGAEGVALYGTTGEGASLGRQERLRGIKAFADAGVPRDKIVLGVCATSVEDAAEQVSEGLAHGIEDFLLLPPFYFKGCDDAGLYDWHAGLFARCEDRARFILYHIPQVTGVPLSVDLVSRLVAAFPTRIRAIKDSSGDWDNAQALLGLKSLPVLVGDERLLHRAAALGGAGAISGVANLYPDRLKRLFDTATEDSALSQEVTRIVSVPVIPALKAIITDRTKEPAWERLRAPLVPLDATQRAVVT